MNEDLFRKLKPGERRESRHVRDPIGTLWKLFGADGQLLIERLIPYTGGFPATFHQGCIEIACVDTTTKKD